MATFEQLIPVGKKFISPGRTIGEGDFTLLVNLTWSTGSIHVNREYMKGTQFGERILPGPCVLACMVGLAGAGGLRQATDHEGVRTVALLGFDGVRFTAPVKPGDTLTVHSEITAVRPTSKDPRRAVVLVRDVTLNQHGQEVMSATRSQMVEMTG